PKVACTNVRHDELADPTMNGGCRGPGGVIVVHDISEKKKAAEERKRLLHCEQNARAEAEAANRAKDEFLAMVSHELRTPLGAILIWSQLLRNEKLDEPGTLRAVGMIERSTRTLAKIIDDLLDVSRNISGKLRP